MTDDELRAAIPEYLGSLDLERLTGVPSSTWRYWHTIGEGPASFKIARRHEEGIPQRDFGVTVDIAVVVKALGVPRDDRVPEAEGSAGTEIVASTFAL